MDSRQNLSRCYQINMISILHATVILLSVCQFLTERLMSLLNDGKMRNLRSEAPSEPTDLMPKETWIKCTDYNLDKSKYAKVEDLFNLFFSLLTLLFVYPYSYHLFAISGHTGILANSVFAALFLVLIQLPNHYFDWRRQFKLEEKFGFNTNTNSNWIVDKIKETMLGLVLCIIFLTIVVGLQTALSARFPEYWWTIVFTACFLFQIILMILWPKLILPLFNKLSPLEDTELSSKLLQLAEKTGFATNRIEVIDGSKRSRHSNAFFTGFGRFRRIVLYDTMIEQMNHDQIVAVVAHEIGHYKMGHLPKRILVNFISGFCLFALLGWAIRNPWIYSQLNLDESHVGTIAPLLVAFSLAGGCLTYWFKPVSNYFSRKHEYEADDFAVRVTGGAEGLSSALRKLYVENLSYPAPHSLLAVFHYSHPTLWERESAMNRAT